MVNVTERAKQELKKLLARKVDWPEARLRLMDRGKGIIGCEYKTQNKENVECLLVLE